MTRLQAEEIAVREYLHASAASTEALQGDLWPRIAASVRADRSVAHIVARPPRVSRRTGTSAMVLALCVTTLAASVGVGLAASPTLRQEVTHVLSWSSIDTSRAPGILFSPTGPVGISPVPRFRLFYPRRTPTTLRYWGFAELTRLGSPDHGDAGMDATCPSDHPESGCAIAAARTVRLLAASPDFKPPMQALNETAHVMTITDRGTKLVWFGFHALLPRREEIQITEWNAHAYNPVARQPIASFEVMNRHEVATAFVRHGTVIVVKTNMGRSVLRRIVALLRPISFHGHVP